MFKLQKTARRGLFAVVLTAVVLISVSCGGYGGGGSTNYGPGGQSGAVTPGVTVVNIPVGAAGLGSNAYGANPLIIKIGTTVKWVNNDSVSHTVTSDFVGWDSGTLIPGSSFSFKFNDVGVFAYHCVIHGEASESGTIQVNP